MNGLGIGNSVLSIISYFLICYFLYGISFKVLSFSKNYFSDECVKSAQKGSSKRAWKCSFPVFLGNTTARQTNQSQTIQRTDGQLSSKRSYTSTTYRVLTGIDEKKNVCISDNLFCRLQSQKKKHIVPNFTTPHT